jgi:bifunctional enzyme CysN/CysC
MVTGASRAQAALLVIDAHEGIRENSRRHGYILSLLGLSQVSILVNKMDLANFDQAAFESVRDEYDAFLASLGVSAVGYIPIAARDGHNIASRSNTMPWYRGPTVLEQVDAFVYERGDAERPFRMPLQDVYKFTESGDDRRIFAGSVASGRVQVGTKVRFLPSRKSSTIASVEAFSAPTRSAIEAGEVVGFTLAEQIYVKPGELMVADNDSTALVTTRLRATVFWMGRAPFVTNRKYILKLGAAKVPVELREVRKVVDATELSTEATKAQLDRHDVGEVILETTRPVACDVARALPTTGRFVIVDHYEIAGCGVVLGEADPAESLLDQRIRQREYAWTAGAVTRADRTARYGHQGKFVLLVSESDQPSEVKAFAEKVAVMLEASLFSSNRRTYYLAMGNLDLGGHSATRDEHIQRLGEQARILTDAGLLFISVLGQAEASEVEALRALNRPAELFLVQVGESAGDFTPSIRIDPTSGLEAAQAAILDRLISHEIVLEYEI